MRMRILYRAWTLHAWMVMQHHLKAPSVVMFYLVTYQLLHQLDQRRNSKGNRKTGKASPSQNMLPQSSSVFRCITDNDFASLVLKCPFIHTWT